MMVTITGVRFPYKHFNCKPFARVQFNRSVSYDEDLDYTETGDFYETALAFPYLYSDNVRQDLDLDDFESRLSEGKTVHVHFSKKLKSYIVNM